MKNYGEKKIEEVKSVTCNCCGQTYDKGDFEFEEFLMWENICGYSSIWEDGVTIEIDLCQYCIKNLLSKYLYIRKDY
jgi:hypothetical protein